MTTWARLVLSKLRDTTIWQHYDLKIGGCGTARPSLALFSSELKVQKSDIGKHKYHALKIAVVKDSVFQEEVGAHLWFDNAPVTTLSTIHKVGCEKERRRKRPGKKSTNAKKVWQAPSEEQENDMMTLLCIDNYNRHIGGIDTANQLRCYYDL